MYYLDDLYILLTQLTRFLFYLLVVLFLRVEVILQIY